MTKEPLPVVTAAYRAATLADAEDRPDLAEVYRSVADAITRKPRISGVELAAVLIKENRP